MASKRNFLAAALIALALADRVLASLLDIDPVLSGLVGGAGET